MKVKTIAFLLLAVLLTFCTTPVYAQGIPPLPHAFHGTVEINGSPAPMGTEVEVRGEGVQTGANNNPIVTTVEGRYGSSNPLEPKLIVQGDIVEGSPVTFYVNGVSAGQTAEWHSGEVTELNLRATIEGPPPGTTGVSGIINSAGVFNKAVIAESSDGLCRLTIDKDTVGLTKDDEPLSEIKMTRMGAPPAPPAGAHIIGQVYNFKPDGAVFNPAATLEYTYDSSKIPEGVAEEELVLAWWDAGADMWVELESTVDPEANTITAPVSHFTAFAALAYEPPEPAAFSLSSLIISPNEVTPSESVTISAQVTNTGEEAGNYKLTLKIDGVVEASKEVTVDAGASQKVIFTTAKDLPGSYSVDINGLSGTFVVRGGAPSPPASSTAPAKPGNWPVLWGIIGGVIVVGLIIFLLARRKAY